MSNPMGGGFGPQGGGFGPQGGGFGAPPGGAYGQPTSRPEPVQIDEKPALIMALLVAFFCCIPGGVVALLLTQSAKTLAVKGDREGAESKLRLSMIISGVSLVLGFIAIVLYVALNIAAGAM